MTPSRDPDSRQFDRYDWAFLFILVVFPMSLWLLVLGWLFGWWGA